MTRLRPFALALGAVLLATVTAGAAPPAKTPATTPAKTPAKQLFGAVREPAALEPQAIGFYSRGCVGGAEALPVTGPENGANGGGPLWQVMRLSRHRMYGHPELIAFLERFAQKVPQVSGWSGILVGDLSQPRGGPMISGHASHQVGLDADIWLTPSPGRVMSADARETTSAVVMVRADRRDIDPKSWRADHWKVIRTAAQDPQVERIFVNAAIKKALCREATGDRSWLGKVRPYWGHDYHMHVRLSCPASSPQCRHQEPPPKGEGCGSELNWWFTEAVLHPKPDKAPSKPKPQVTLKDLPPACAIVLEAK